MPLDYMLLAFFQADWAKIFFSRIFLDFSALPSPYDAVSEIVKGFFNL